MINTNQNKLYLENSIGIFLGQFNDNVPHKHYALQISIASGRQFKIIDNKNNKYYFSSCLINSNVQHQYINEEISLIILINPISSIGHQLFNKYRDIKISSLNEDFDQLTEIFDNYIKKDISFSDLVNKIKFFITKFKCKCEQENHFEDERIYKAIQFIEQNSERIVSLEEISKFCFLSETRFLHLFKEKTNLNFRRYQLWRKLIKSLSYLKKQSITKTAHQFGFTDSSHYNRTFKETFGVNPKFLLASE